MALVGGYFMVGYFALVPGRETQHPWFLLFTLNDALPAVWAAALAWAVREQPFRAVYRWLAAGFLGGALVDVPANWAAVHGRFGFLGPLDLALMLPLVAIASAALCPRATSWVQPAAVAAAGRGRARAAALAVAVPPCLDLAMRAFGVQPVLAGTRSLLVLLTSAALSLLVALRVRHSGPLALPHAEAPHKGEPSEFLQFASGAAHELNNPLMAIAGWAELSLRRGVPAEPLQELLASTRATADAVERLQRLARSSRSDPKAGS
jgi:signal transduction histidine kinase